MDWYDVDDILYNGTLEQIKSVRCPDCNSEIKYEFVTYRDGTNDFIIKCNGCGYFSKGYNGAVPNCIKFKLSKNL